MDKFVEPTINTYSKKNLILTSKHTQESFYVNLEFNLVKFKFMWNQSITSTIYRNKRCFQDKTCPSLFIKLWLCHCVNKEKFSSTQKRTNQRKKKKKYIKNEEGEERSKQTKYLCLFTVLSFSLSLSANLKHFPSINFSGFLIFK